MGVSFAAVAALVVGLLVRQAGSDAGGDQGADADLGRTFGLLTEKDPVCDDWIKVADELANVTVPWSEVNKATPESNWNSEQRRAFEDAAGAMSIAADRFEAVMPKVSHVVLKELIGQSIVHLRLYVQRLPRYNESDSLIAGVAINFTAAVTYMCTAVPTLGQNPDVPHVRSRVSGTAFQERFLEDGDRACGDFLSLIGRQNTVLAGWEATDPAIPASKWTPEQRQLNLALEEVLTKDAEQARNLAANASDAIFGDLLSAYSSYVGAYVAKLPLYEPDDNQIWRVATYIGGGLAAACEAA